MTKYRTITVSASVPENLVALLQEEAAARGISLSGAIARGLARGLGLDPDALPQARTSRTAGVTTLAAARAEATKRAFPTQMGDILNTNFCYADSVYAALLLDGFTWQATGLPLTDAERSMLRTMRPKFAVPGM